MKIDVKLEKREKIYEGKFIDFYVDHILINRKVKTKREYIKYPKAVGIIPVTEDNKIVMVEQYRYTNNLYSLEIPAGKLDEGESEEDGVHRELREEIGYDARDIERMYEYYPAISYSKEKLVIYIARNLEKSALPPDEDEFILTKYYTLDELIDMIKDNKITDSKTILSLLYYKMFYTK